MQYLLARCLSEAHSQPHARTHTDQCTQSTTTDSRCLLQVIFVAVLCFSFMGLNLFGDQFTEFADFGTSVWTVSAALPPHLSALFPCEVTGFTINFLGLHAVSLGVSPLPCRL